MNAKQLSKHILALIMAASLLTLAGCGSSSGDVSSSAGSSGESSAAGTAVQVQTVSRDTVATDSRISGTVVSDDQSTIYVSVSAKCIETYADAGDTVSAGDTLCTLDLESTLASFRAAQITYNSSVQSYNDQSAVLDQQLALTEKNLNDTKALFEIGAASQAEVDQAELSLASTKATRDSSLSQLQAAIESTKSQLDQLSTALENVDGNGNVIAPISGTLVSMSAVKDGYVSAGVPVAVIDGAAQMKITASVSEALVPKLAIGDTADVTIGAANQSFSAAITAVERTANAQTKLYTVSLAVPDGVDGLLSGMFADVTFHTDRSEDTVVIPTEAIQTSGDTQYVYIVVDNAAKYVEVTTGLTGSGITEVTSGLESGDQLVTVGQSYLEDGAPVRIVGGEA